MHGTKVDGKNDEREHYAKERAREQAGELVALMDS